MYKNIFIIWIKEKIIWNVIKKENYIWLTLIHIIHPEITPKSNKNIKLIICWPDTYLICHVNYVVFAFSILAHLINKSFYVCFMLFFVFYFLYFSFMFLFVVVLIVEYLNYPDFTSSVKKREFSYINVKKKLIKNIIKKMIIGEF